MKYQSVRKRLATFVVIFSEAGAVAAAVAPVDSKSSCEQ